MSKTQLDEIEASIRELEVTVSQTTPGTPPHKILQDQIKSMRDVGDLLRKTMPQVEEMKQHRVPLSQEMKSFFTPAPPAEIPTWFVDQTTRGDVRPDMMRATPPAQVYEHPDALSCAIPGQPGVSLSTPHGLTISFHSDGKLRSQNFYERGLCRWSISYHATGHRDAAGFYVSTEPKQYIEDGLHTRHAPNGTITSQCEWKAGKKHGWWKNWEDDGYPIGAHRYEDDREVEAVFPDGSRRRT
jgi:hypothetical protein